MTVTATSPSLQGPRAVVTNEVGDYIIPFLPPGEYTLTFELQGFQCANQKTLVTAAATVPLDAKLQVGGVSEAITVTGSVTEAFTAGRQRASTTLKQDLVNELPLNRGLDQTIALTPGALRTGPSNSNTGNQQIAISGAHHLREPDPGQRRRRAGQRAPHLAAAVHRGRAAGDDDLDRRASRPSSAGSAGGIVNAITKSGGNAFSGSFRTSFNNDAWRALTPLAGDTTIDSLVPTYEYTVGGPIFRDRLWFFHAGRYENEKLGRNLFAPVNTPYTRADAAPAVRRQGHLQPVERPHRAGDAI